HPPRRGPARRPAGDARRVAGVRRHRPCGGRSAPRPADGRPALRRPALNRSPTLSHMQRAIGFEEEHEQFRSSVRAFFEKEALPPLVEWERAGVVDRALFERAGSNGFLGMDAPIEFGGGGVADFRYNLIIIEEVQRLGLGGAGLGITLHNDICMPYFLHL